MLWWTTSFCLSILLKYSSFCSFLDSYVIVVLWKNTVFVDYLWIKKSNLRLYSLRRILFSKRYATRWVKRELQWSNIDTNLIKYTYHFLEINKTVKIRLIAFVGERHIFTQKQTHMTSYREQTFEQNDLEHTRHGIVLIN